VWDEAVKISGADPDFHRRDLWEAIEAGAYPEWELSVQIFTEEDAERFSFDVLDATKIVPEELVPLKPIGRMVLNRNPDNFFAETEQVAFCTAHIVPGIDFSNDPLLAGRIHSYVDTQITRLGGPNFHEIPINAPVAQVHNNQRDGSIAKPLRAGVSPMSLTRSPAAAHSKRVRAASCPILRKCKRAKCGVSPSALRSTTIKRRCFGRARPMSSELTSFAHFASSSRKYKSPRSVSASSRSYAMSLKSWHNALPTDWG
jgi:catalase